MNILSVYIANGDQLPGFVPCGDPDFAHPHDSSLTEFQWLGRTEKEVLELEEWAKRNGLESERSDNES
jgi:hypothetical protein